MSQQRFMRLGRIRVRRMDQWCRDIPFRKEGGGMSEQTLGLDSTFNASA
jgi:hypothetical protein